jgi:hypothetical protein
MCSRYARVPDPWRQSVLLSGLAGTNHDKSLCNIVEIIRLMDSKKREDCKKRSIRYGEIETNLENIEYTKRYV